MTLAYTNGCESYIPTDEAFQSGGYEAASFPSVAAALRYRNRIALRPGVENQIKDAIRSVRSSARRGASATFRRRNPVTQRSHNQTA